MKKTSKVFGALALSAALAMGVAMPAFAAPYQGNDLTLETEGKAQTVNVNNAQKSGDISDSSEKSSTVLTVKTYTSQISVTIPLTLPFAADTVGGAGMAPADYSITNDSIVPITISKAAYNIQPNSSGKTPADDWTFGIGEFNSAGAPALRISGDPDSSPVNPLIGSFYMKLTLAEDQESDVAGEKALELKAQLPEGVDATQGSATMDKTQGLSSSTKAQPLSQELDWVIQPSKEAKIDIAASSSKLLKPVDSATKVAAITYTVSVA